VALVFLIAVLVVGWLLYHVHLKKMLTQGKSGKLKLILIGLGLIFLVLALTGRAHALFAIIGAAMTQIMRIAPLLMRFAPSLSKHFGGIAGAAAGSGAPGASTVSTATLLMSLDHTSGTIDGKVTAGEFQDRELSSMSQQELRDLYSYCASHDTEALRLLQTYIQRHRASEWQGGPQSSDQGQQSTDISSSSMSVDEAKLVLGLSGDITRKTISEAHRSLMGQFHPDKGGSDYLATKINSARDVLLQSLKS